MSRRRARRRYRNRKSYERLMLFARSLKVKNWGPSPCVDVFRVARAMSESIRQATLSMARMSLPAVLLTVNPSSYSAARLAMPFHRSRSNEIQDYDLEQWRAEEIGNQIDREFWSHDDPAMRLLIDGESYERVVKRLGRDVNEVVNQVVSENEAARLFAIEYPVRIASRQADGKDIL